jgi:hypothetical protein
VMYSHCRYIAFMPRIRMLCTNAILDEDLMNWSVYCSWWISKGKTDAGRRAGGRAYTTLNGRSGDQRERVVSPHGVVHMNICSCGLCEKTLLVVGRLSRLRKSVPVFWTLWRRFRTLGKDPNGFVCSGVGGCYAIYFGDRTLCFEGACVVPVKSDVYKCRGDQTNEYAAVL